MPASLRQTLVRTALMATLISLGGAHAPAIASPPQAIVLETCPMAGRDPSVAMLRFSCGVPTPGDFTAPTWRTLEMMAIDGNSLGGGVVARLQCMSRATGAVSTVAIVKSAQSSKPKKVAAPIPAPLDFRLCAYFVRVDQVSTNAVATPLMVVLRN